MKHTKMILSITFCLLATMAQADTVDPITPVAPTDSIAPVDSIAPTDSVPTITFTQMRRQLNALSLPLVNLTVDISKVQKPVYTDATIEIADPQMRTNQKDTLTTFRCK